VEPFILFYSFFAPLGIVLGFLLVRKQYDGGEEPYFGG
jgi:hypothetical protein